MPFLSMGECEPDVTMPISSPSAFMIGVPWRAGAPWMTKPARLRFADLLVISSRMRSEPTKEPGTRRDLATTQKSVPSAGEVVVSRSLP